MKKDCIIYNSRFLQKEELSYDIALKTAMILYANIMTTTDPYRKLHMVNKYYENYNFTLEELVGSS